MSAANRQIRHVAITGATGGIGGALARQFAESGRVVSAIGRSQKGLDALSAAHASISGFRADVSQGSACASAFAAASEANGPIDVLIAAAAIYPKAFFFDQEPGHLEDTLRVNVVGVANAMRCVLPAMLERNFGRIVVFGSLADMNPLPGSLAYSVSKGALHSLVKGVAGEIDRDRFANVLVNEFSPGATRTAMSDGGHEPEDIYPMLLPLVDCGADGPHGRFFQEGKEVRLGESWKGTIKRLVLRR